MLLRKDINNLRLRCRRDGFETKTITEALFAKLKEKQFFFNYEEDSEHRCRRVGCASLIAYGKGEARCLRWKVE